MIPKIYFSREIRILLILLFSVFLLALFRIIEINKINLKYNLDQQKAFDLQYEIFDKKTDIIATNIYIYNFTKNEEIYSKRKDQKKPIASLTKLMTSVVAEVYSNSKITIKHNMLTHTETDYISSGQIISKDILERIMLVGSSNNIAEVFKYSLLTDKNIDLIKEMNFRAQKLGLINTLFINPTGLDEEGENNISTAEEIGQLSYYVFKKIPQIVSSTTQKEFNFENTLGEKIIVPNTNQKVTEIPLILLSKTGYTENAGGTLTILFKASYNKDIIGITILNSRKEERFSDILTLVKRSNLYLELMDIRDSDYTKYIYEKIN